MDSETSLVTTVSEGTSLAHAEDRYAERTIEDVASQVAKVQGLMGKLMKNDVHYGTVPGTKKETLYKQGAEKICLLFELRAAYAGVERIDLPGGHREYIVRCELIHRPSGELAGEGVGSCTSMETKYRYRKADHVCPNCGKEAIIKGKKEYGGGWLCFKKKGGCDSKWSDESEQGKLFAENPARIENEDLADQYNTILKMAKKRAFVDATITVGAVSDMFTQDIEDFAPQVSPEEEAPAAKMEPPTEEELSAVNAAAIEAFGIAIDEKTPPEVSEYLKKFTGIMVDAYAHGTDLVDLSQKILSRSKDAKAGRPKKRKAESPAKADAEAKSAVEGIYQKVSLGLKLLLQEGIIAQEEFDTRSKKSDDYLGAGNEKSLKEMHEAATSAFDKAAAAKAAEAPAADDDFEDDLPFDQKEEGLGTF
jgi:predicted RNA-binding Zn-ribbon protein involved in translation (DUF1610 family)